MFCVKIDRSDPTQLHLARQHGYTPDEIARMIDQLA